MATSRTLTGIVLYGALIGVVLSSPVPYLGEVDWQSIDDFLHIQNMASYRLSRDFEYYRPHLPPVRQISFIMDEPFDRYSGAAEQFYMAQSTLAPLILNPEAEEAYAIVYTSGSGIAEQRLRQLDYRMIVPLGGGKGIAAKIP